MGNVLAALIVAVALVTDVASGPSAALAWDRRHPHGRGTAVTVVPPKPFLRHGFPCCAFPHPVRPFVRPFFFHRHFFPVVVYPSPTYVYAPPPVYASPPVGYAEPQSVLVAPPPTAPSVIQYSTGRYELRGDGITTPYTWVWIPNPPPEPPASPEAPPAPPQGRVPDPPGSASSSARVPGGPLGEIYHWTDDEGVNYWTDRLDRVPERYRPNARSQELPEVGS